jgi:hypothetical protein
LHIIKTIEYARPRLFEAATAALTTSAICFDGGGVLFAESEVTRLDTGDGVAAVVAKK